ncbi:MAG: exosortase-associated EpsI family protein [Planctomycetota bacterium]
MFNERARAVIPLVIAAAFVAVVTAVQGVWTERWSDRDIAGELKVSATILEEAFPAEIGPWKYVDDVESSQEQLERAGAVGHVSRLYQNKDTGAKVAAFVICATPHDASGHTPDRCYPAAGFEIAETEHRETITLEDGRRAEAFVGTFRKTGQTIRVYWTYGVRGEWLAPQIARIELAGTAAVYKLYAIIDQTAVSAPQSSGICREFLSVMLPAFDRAVAERLDTKPADATAESTATGSVFRSADAGVPRGSGATAAGGGG